MATIRVKGEIIITRDSGEDAPIPFDFSKTVTAIEDRVYTFAPNDTKALFDPAVDVSEPASTYDFLMFLATGNLDVEATTASSSDIMTYELVSGLPTMWGSDRSSGAVALGGTNFNDISKWRADEAGSSTVTLRMVLAKV